MWRGRMPRHLFYCWPPTAATVVAAMNRVDVVALNALFVLRLSKSGRTVGWTDSRLDGCLAARLPLQK